MAQLPSIWLSWPPDETTSWQLRHVLSQEHHHKHWVMLVKLLSRMFCLATSCRCYILAERDLKKEKTNWRAFWGTHHLHYKIFTSSFHPRHGRGNGRGIQSLCSLLLCLQHLAKVGNPEWPKNLPKRTDLHGLLKRMDIFFVFFCFDVGMNWQKNCRSW